MEEKDLILIDERFKKNVIVKFSNGKKYEYISEFNALLGDLVEVEGAMNKDKGTVIEERPYKDAFYMKNVVAVYRNNKTNGKENIDEILFEYKKLKNNEIELIKCHIQRSVIEIPSIIDGFNVTKLGNKLFYDFKKVDEIIVPNTVHTIGKETFRGCFNLELTIPDSIKKIGIECFAGIKKLNISETHPNFIIENDIVYDKDKKTVYQAMYQQIVNDYFVSYIIEDITLPETTEVIEEGFLALCNNDLTISIPDTLKKIKPKFLGSRYSGTRFMNEVVKGVVEIIVRHENSQDDKVVFFLADESNKNFTDIFNFKDKVSIDYDKYTKLYFDINAIPKHSVQSQVYRFKKITLFNQAVFAMDIIDKNRPKDAENIKAMKTFLKRSAQTFVDYLITNEYDLILQKYLSLEIFSEKKLESVIKKLEGTETEFNHSQTFNLLKAYFKEKFQESRNEELKATEEKYFSIKKMANGIEISGFIKEKTESGSSRYIYKNPTDLVIPNEIEGIEVVSIGIHAFSHDKIKSIALGKNITTIKRDAFYNCEKLKKVDLNSGLKTIDKTAFEFCISLGQLNIPNTVMTIKEGAFKSSGLRHLTYEEPIKLKRLDKEAYQDTEIEEIIFSPNIDTIKKYTYKNCGHFLKPQIIPSFIKYIKSNALEGTGYYLFNENSKLELLESYSISEILSSITLPETVKKIESMVFRTLPSYDEKMALPIIVTIKSRHLEMDKGACSDDLVLAFPNTDKFKDYKLNSSYNHLVVIKETLKTKDYLLGITHEDECYILKSYSDVSKLIIPSVIENYPVIGIGPYAFFGDTTLENISYQAPSNLKYLAKLSFSNCENLKSIKIPATTEMIVSNVFSDCTKLNEIEFEEGSELRLFDVSAIENTLSLRELTVPRKAILGGIGSIFFDNTNLIINQEGVEIYNGYR